ncbi:MAG: L-aspartate oxidase [Crocinitomicaceae bacterium]|nr:L-aspartate oxidase [Crocinitomicaceae bacterium]
MNTNTLVIGSGIAGLSLAIKLAEKQSKHKIIIVSKSDKSESNTYNAQGGMAVVLDHSDSFENHINDTLVAGHFLNDKAIVELVIQSAPERLAELIAWGANFDVKDSGQLDLGLEGGHSKNRIVHHKDKSGKEIYRALAEKAASFDNIKILENLFIADLLMPESKDSCLGAIAIEKKSRRFINIAAQNTVIASGGIGQVFQHTTNPRSATGDGIAIAARAGAYLADMNFVQFHPTALYCNENPTFLISEATRGFGAYLVNDKGERFMKNVDPRMELATRDVVSDAILEQMTIGQTDHVFLDCRHLDAVQFKKSFPVIHQRLETQKINPQYDLIPVAPAAHYLCGGIAVDTKGRTNVKNLYSCGESSRTGLHGANRLASNSLLEALVFADQVANELAGIPGTIPTEVEIRQTNEKQTGVIDYAKIIQQVKWLMTNRVGIKKDIEPLQQAQTEINELKQVFLEQTNTLNASILFYETWNLITVAGVIIEHSLEAKKDLVVG